MTKQSVLDAAEAITRAYLEGIPKEVAYIKKGAVAPTLVYVLLLNDVVLGVFSSAERAEHEAADLRSSLPGPWEAVKPRMWMSVDDNVPVRFTAVSPGRVCRILRVSSHDLR